MSIRVCSRAGEETEFLSFSKPGLLPAGQELVVHPGMHLCTLACTEGGKIRFLQQVPFSAYACRMLICLLEAYPSWCSYEELLLCLPRQEQQSTRREVLRPVRRAIQKATKQAHILGLMISPVHKAGYVLRSTSTSTAESRDARP